MTNQIFRLKLIKAAGNILLPERSSHLPLMG
jgi:hypothetical protein